MTVLPGPGDTLPSLIEPCSWDLTTYFVTPKLTPFLSSSVAFAEMREAQDHLDF